MKSDPKECLYCQNNDTLHRTIERQIQTAKNLTPETKEIIKKSGGKISKEAALRLSRLEKT